MNPTSKTSVKRGSGGEFATEWDGETRERFAEDIREERADLDRKVAKERLRKPDS